MFRAARVDYSLHRIFHYTGTDPEHFQNFVIFTNYQFYVDVFGRLSHEQVASPLSSCDAFVEPGNVITRNAHLGGGTSGVVPERVPQMPAFHLVEPGYAASRLFKERGLGAVSIADIAATADAFPSQITYYFRTKEALFVEAACRDVLYVARAAEEHAGKQLSPEDYTRALVESVMGSDAVGFFVEAMTLTRRRQDLAPLVERTVERLHAEGLRAYAGEIAARGWHSRLDPETSARRFWADRDRRHAEGHAMGRSSDDLAAEMLRLIGTQADAPPEAARLRLVTTGNSPPDMSPAGKEK